MKALSNLDLLAPGLRCKIAPYMEGLLKIHDSDILSIFLYGDCAIAEPAKEMHCIDSVVVFKTLGFKQLKSSLHLINKGINSKIKPPLFITPDHIKSSCDTFPVEFLEMQENHILLYGDDFLRDLRIEQSHIRFVCEQQLKGKLMRIRQAYLEIGLRRKGIEILIKDSLYSLMPIFRGLLRLKGIKPPLSGQELFDNLSKTFGVDGAIFMAVINDDKNDERIGKESIEVFMEKFIDQIDKLCYISDAL